MKTKLALVTASIILSFAAMAAEPHVTQQPSALTAQPALDGGAAIRYTAYADSTPVFKYSDVVAENPLHVTATSEDGKCHFHLVLTGYLEASMVNKALTGRVERAVCDGADVTFNFSASLATVTAQGSSVVIDKAVQVVLGQ